MYTDLKFIMHNSEVVGDTSSEGEWEQSDSSVNDQSSNVL